jgi:DNA-binding NtrC family response regulator
MSTCCFAAYRPEATLEEQLADCTRAVLETALARARGNQLRAADSLGIHRNTLARHCVELGISPTTFRPKRRPGRRDVLEVMRAIGESL